MNNVNCAREDSEQKNYKNKNQCHKCQLKFDSREKLQYHVRTLYPKTIECSVCEDTFDMNWKLEKHMKSHSIDKSFNCDECGMTFFLEWRLKKHKTGHQSKFNKRCHTFNNNKTCPFMEIGCKFLHEASPKCMFGEHCRNNLCSFQH